MEPALKQRLVGASVLVALAVIFLPMLIKGPAPESGASDVPLELPDAPAGEFETRELPLLAPAGAPQGGAVGMPVDGAPAAADSAPAAADAMMPPPAPGGGFAVTFGSYASEADAARVVDALRASQLPGYQEPGERNGRTLYRVLVGPYADQATAEAARLRAAHVRDDVGSKVIALNPDAADPAPAATASVSEPAAASEPTVSQPTPLPAEPNTAKPAKPAPAERTASEPAARPAAPAKPAPAATPAAAPAVGFAVQLGAFSNDAEAAKLRDRARAAGFSAFIDQVRSEQGVLSRVQIGPVADRDAAERLKAQVAARLGVSGYVHSHP